MVKFGHGRPYKRTLVVPCKGDKKTEALGRRKENKKKNKEKKKIREKTKNREKQIQWACTSRSFFH